MSQLVALLARNVLTVVRYSDFKTSSSALFTFQRTLTWLRLYRGVDADQHARLLALATNACRYAIQDAKRRIAQKVPANEHQLVSAAAPCRELRLLCVLVKDRTGSPRFLPVHTLRPLPPRISAQGKWSLADHPGFHLRETYAQPAPAAVLARVLHHGKAHAFRADSRAVHAGGLTA